MPLNRRLTAQIDSVLDLCGQHLFQGVAFLSHDDTVEVRCGRNVCPFCEACLASYASAGYCRRSALGNAYQSLHTGEPSYFRCWMGLTSVVVPVAPGGRLIGAVELGGFHFPEEEQSNLLFVRNSLRHVGARIAEDMMALFVHVPTVGPRAVRGAATFLFDSLFSSGLNDVDTFRENRDKYMQQRRIAELMHRYDARSMPPTDTLGMLSGLVLALRSRDRDRMLLLLDDFFCRILLSSGASLDQLKANVHLLLSVLAREAVVNAKTQFDTTMARHFRTFRELEELHDPTDICYWTSKQVDLHLQNPAGRSVLDERASTRALQWIQAHFMERIRLEDVAREVNASVSGLVHALRKETGKTFHDHLQSARLREAKRLLVNTDLPLYAIASECGFYDQSHFCRAFKASFSQTPSQFRKNA